ncbi:MAG: sensor histidine kinase [Bacteroidales bacterium]
MQKDFSTCGQTDDKRSKGIHIMNHLFFWLSFIALNLWLNGISGYTDLWSSLALIFLTDVLAILLLAYVIYPRLYFVKSPFYFLLTTFLTFLAALGVKILILHYDSSINFNELEKLPAGFQLQIMLSVAYYALAMLWAAVRMRIKENKSICRKYQMQELKHLNSQMNPHMLFNILNNVHILIEKNKTRARDMLASLSDVLRYQLYTEPDKKVLLRDEIQNVRDLMDLWVSKSPDADYEFNIKGNPGIKKVHPFLFLPIVENACKYGISGQNGGFVVINLDIKDNAIIFETENEKKNLSKSNKSKGIGLYNLHRRLKLLYTDKYELKIEDFEHKYKVKLVLTLN